METCRFPVVKALLLATVGLVAFASVALLLGEIHYPVTRAADARSEEIARSRAAAADATVEIVRKTAADYERIAADESKSLYVRGLYSKNAEEARQRMKQEESRATSERAEAEYHARLRVRPGTRYPALFLLAFGIFLELIPSRQRRRLKDEPNNDDVALG